MVDQGFLEEGIEQMRSIVDFRKTEYATKDMDITSSKNVADTLLVLGALHTLCRAPEFGADFLRSAKEIFDAIRDSDELNDDEIFTNKLLEFISENKFR